MKHWHKGKVIKSRDDPRHPLYKCKLPKDMIVKTSEDDVSQPVAKTYMPPKVSIWRNNGGGAWCVHCKPHKRHSEPWANFEGNSRLALCAAIAFAWSTWLEDNCLDLVDCPIKGVFEEPVKPPVVAPGPAVAAPGPAVAVVA